MVSQILGPRVVAARVRVASGVGRRRTGEKGSRNVLAAGVA